MRTRNKKRRRFASIARLYETAGDTAMKRSQQVRALAKFEKALAHVPTIRDEIRICEKIGWIFYKSARPEHAIPWLKRIPQKYLELRDPPRAAEAMVRLARVHVLELNTPEALACVERAHALLPVPYDEVTFDSPLPWIEMRKALYLARLGRYEEVAALEMSDKPHDDAAFSQPHYFRTRATIYAARGNLRRAFSDFASALDLLKNEGHSFPPMSIAADYALWAIAFGHLDVAISNYELALFIARGRGVKWRIPFFGLHLAGALTRAGDYVRAKDILASLVSSDTEAPVLRVLRSIVTFRLGFATQDEELLKRAPDNKALELAFQSEEPQQIGPLVASHVKLEVSLGNIGRAKQLIARAIPAIKQADHAWDLLALAARYGTTADARRGKALLVERMQLPHHRVAAAYLELWETYAALRKNEIPRAHLHGEKAIHLFARLGWKYQHAEALAVVGKRHSTFHDFKPELTLREQEVVELVFRGLTNRSIAESLEISESTVESHMTSILSRLGLRSRWQLMQFVRS